MGSAGSATDEGVRSEDAATAVVAFEPSAAVWDAGSRIGRFVVEEEFGAGAMGRVLRAHDPELQRDVAIKLLHAGGEEAAARALREAQALARLSHPNVVTVYDVGRAGDAVFFAMELVRGGTLRDFMNAGPHPWPQIVALFRAAGAGLAAAHEAGLVHRDFKPSNVLVDDGKGAERRVRVTDFGLARGMNDPQSDASSRPSTLDAEPDARLTRDGIVLGTPAYMAPEQHRGVSATAKSDQYAFCIALWEALYGARPFGGNDLEELCREKERGVEAVGRSDVPARLRAVVTRGLAPDPDARWPSMQELLAALPVRSRRPAVAVGVAFVALAAIGVTVAVADPERSLCAGADRLHATWNDEARSAIGNAFAATDVVYAESTASRVVARLDAYAEAWREGWTNACTATHVDGAPTEILDARMLCLAERERAFAAIVEMLRAADATVLEHAVQATAALPDVALCEDAQYVSSDVAPPQDPATADAVETLRARLARVAAKSSAGKYAEGVADANAILVDARALGYAPVIAEAQLRLARLQMDAGAYADAEQNLRTAYFDAETCGHAKVATAASTQLAFVLGRHLARMDDALQWIDHARAHVERSGDPMDRAQLEGTLAVLDQERGELASALGHYIEALAIEEAHSGPDDPGIASTLLNMGSLYGQRAELDASLEYSSRALAILREALGSDHPDVADALGNVGNIHLMRGELDLAKEHHAKALSVLENAFGPDDPLLARALNNLGIVLNARGENDAALLAHERALALREKAHGPDHPVVARAWISLGNTQRSLGKPDEALAAYRRAARIFEETLGPQHADTAMALNNVGVILEQRNELPEALAIYQRALAIFEQVGGPDHLHVASGHNNIGNVLEQSGHPAEALPHHERALAIREKNLPADHPDLQNSRTAVARARGKI